MHSQCNAPCFSLSYIPGPNQCQAIRLSMPVGDCLQPIAHTPISKATTTPCGLQIFITRIKRICLYGNPARRSVLMNTVQEPHFHTGWDQSGNSNKATGSMHRLFEIMSLLPTTHSQPKDHSFKRNGFLGLLTSKSASCARALTDLPLQRYPPLR